MGYERRLCHTALSSSSPTHPNSSSTTSPLCRSLSPSRSTTSSSSASSAPTPTTTPNATTRKRYTKNRTRKSLAEEQELHRIMDPVYLGQDLYCSNNRGGGGGGGGCYYHADPEGYWHDIDYRPFRRIREKERSWTSESSLCGDDIAFGRRGMKTTGHAGRKESLAYWETFVPVGRYSPTLDETSGCTYSAFQDRTPPASPTLPNWSSSCHHSYPDPKNESNDEEDGLDKRRGLLTKKKRTKNDLSNSHDEYSSSSSGDEWLSSSPSSSSDPEKHDISKPKPQSLNSRSKMILRKTWITTTFIARLKVIRTKRWLRERVVVVLSP